MWKLVRLLRCRNGLAAVSLKSLCHTVAHTGDWKAVVEVCHCMKVAGIPTDALSHALIVDVRACNPLFVFVLSAHVHSVLARNPFIGVQTRSTIGTKLGDVHQASSSWCSTHGVLCRGSKRGANE